MQKFRTQALIVVGLVVIVITGAAAVVYAYCPEEREIWSLTLTSKTVDGEPVEDLSDYESLDVSVGEYHSVHRVELESGDTVSRQMYVEVNSDERSGQKRLLWFERGEFPAEIREHNEEYE